MHVPTRLARHEHTPADAAPNGTHGGWEPSLALQLGSDGGSQAVAASGGGGGGGSHAFLDRCLDWLPQLQPGDMLAFMDARRSEAKAPEVTCTSPVFSDGSEEESEGGCGLRLESALSGRDVAKLGRLWANNQQLREKRNVAFGRVHIRVFDCTASPENPDYWGLQGADYGGAVKDGDGPAPEALLLEGLIRRHHAGLLAGGAAAILGVTEARGLRLLQPAGARLGELLAQLEDVGCAGILPSMIRLTAEHGDWLSELHGAIEQAAAISGDAADAGPRGLGGGHERPDSGEENECGANKRQRR